MLNRKLAIFVLLVGWCSSFSVHAQDASGRDVEKKAGPPAKSIPPKPVPTAKAPVVKPAREVVAKPKAMKPAPSAKVIKAKPVTPTPLKKITPTAIATSRLTLIAVPNAQVELGGVRRGLTDANGRLVLNEIPFGIHSLKITADGYDPWSGALEAKTAVTDLNVSLKKRITTGALVITVNQPDVQIFINDKLNVKSVAGRSLTVEGLLPGTHQIRAVKTGFKEWRSVVKVAVAESSPVEITMMPGLTPEMARVAAGEFTMGNNSGPKDSAPAHPVLLGEFEISRREITNQFYKAFVDASNHPTPNAQLSGWQGNNFPAGKADAPVTGISWDDAQAFCKWLSREAGGTFRLPTEAEWERATRAVGGTDLIVSVKWEWCQDWYDPKYYERKDRLSPQGPALRPNVEKGQPLAGRVIRGASETVAGRALRAFERNAAPPEQGRGDIGFRVVREGTMR